MEAITIIVLVSLVMFSTGILAAFLANLKNRNVSTWAAWGFLIPPSVLLLLFLGKNNGARPRRPSLDEEDQMHP